jgi:predicted SprT family Zn-dependent metalloprotease
MKDRGGAYATVSRTVELEVNRVDQKREETMEQEMEQQMCHLGLWWEEQTRDEPKK